MMNRKHIQPSALCALPLMLACLVCTLACKWQGNVRSVLAVPQTPIYSDSTQWHIIDRHAPIDLFYIVSTETGDYLFNGAPCHYADTYNDSIRRLLYAEMVGVDEIMTNQLNYFSPYYRQCTLQSFTSSDLMQKRIPLAMGDVRRAFAHYLQHLNGGRPFILAGFSQGAYAVVELLKEMDSATCRRMVAAYVIGWHVTAHDVAQTPNLRPAQDSADLGVTICYNSVRDNSCAIPLISEDNCVAINPVNWRTDATPAKLISPISPDAVTVTLDTNTLLMTVEGYSRTDYVLPLIGREGNYHSLEISLYQQCLRRNIALRAERFVTRSHHD